VKDLPPEGVKSGIELAALDGRDGATRWTWRGGNDLDRQVLTNEPLCLADFGGRGGREVCLNVGTANGRRRILILDAHGRERSGRDVGQWITLASADLDGDGRDELLFHDDGRLRASRGDLKDLWSWPCLDRIREVLPARAGQPATVVLNSMVGLDGTTGRPIWSGGPSKAVLETADARSVPRLLTGPEGATVCRMALPTSAEGAYQPARGESAKPSRVRKDPGWERALPWASEGNRTQYPVRYLALAGIALIDVVVPLAILWLATRKRFWSVRMLLALPVVIAIPLGVGLTLKRLLPVELPDPIRWHAFLFFTLVSLAGLPPLAYLALVGSTLVRRRWRRLALIVGLTAIVAAVIGTYWLQSDMQSMPAIEHYSWSAWHLLAWPAAYAVGLLVLIGWALRRAGRMTMRLGRRVFTRPV